MIVQHLPALRRMIMSLAYSLYNDPGRVDLLYVVCKTSCLTASNFNRLIVSTPVVVK